MSNKIKRKLAPTKWYYLIVKYYDGKIECYRFDKSRRRHSARAMFEIKDNVKATIYSDKPVPGIIVVDE